MENLRRLLPPLSSLLPFEATARLGSITRAGAGLNLTQAAISKQIKSLEQDLGTQLFERRNRAVYLTEEGQELGRIVSEALGSIGTFCGNLRQKHKDGEIVLHSQLCEGLYWLMPRLSKFYQEHPGTAVKVSVSTKPITEATERFDLALQTAGRETGDAKLAFAAEDEVFPICSPKYLENLQGRASIDRLPSYRLLHHRVYPQDWIDWDSWLEGINSDVRVGYAGAEYDSYPIMIQAALEGLGIGLGWHRNVESYLAVGSLVRPFEEHLSVPDGLCIYQPAGWHPRSGTRALLKWLKSELS